MGIDCGGFVMKVATLVALAWPSGRMGMLETLSRRRLPSLINTMSRYSNSAKL